MESREPGFLDRGSCEPFWSFPKMRTWHILELTIGFDECFSPTKRLTALVPGTEQGCDGNIYLQ